MNVIEFLGFIVSFLAFIYLVFLRRVEKWKKKHNPELDEFLKSIDEDMEHETKPAHFPHPPKKVTKKLIPPPKLVSEPYHEVDLAYVTTQDQPSRAKQLLNQLPTKQQMVIFHEILDKPKALRR